MIQDPQDYFLPPDIERSPLTGISFLVLSLTSVVCKEPQSPMLKFNVTVNSWIPTFYLLDPTSYMIMIYDGRSNSFQLASSVSRVDYGYSISVELNCGDVLEFGIFAYYQLEKISFGEEVSIYYPRGIVYELGHDLINLTYSFPYAKYKKSPSGATKLVIRKIDHAINIIPSNYETLGRFSFKTDSPGLNMTLSSVTLHFQTDSDYFYNVDSQLREVDPSSIICVYLFANTLYNPTSMTIKDGKLTCFMDNYYSNNYQLLIVAKLKIKPPKPSPSSLIPMTLTSSQVENIFMERSDMKLYEIMVPIDSTIAFSTTFLSFYEAKPIFYIGKGHSPSETHYDDILNSGEGRISNTGNRVINIYILIVNTNLNMNSFSFTANIYANPKPVPTPSGLPFSIFYLIIILPLVLILLVGMCLFLLVIVIFIIRRRRKKLASASVNLEENDCQYYQADQI